MALQTLCTSNRFPQFPHHFDAASPPMLRPSQAPNRPIDHPGTSRESDQFDRLWRQAHSIQTQLSNLSGTAASNNQSDASLRLQLLYTLQDILLGAVNEAFKGVRTHNPTKPYVRRFSRSSNKSSAAFLQPLRDALISRNVDELIWNLIFHKKIEELRQAAKVDPLAIKSLMSMLNTAAKFYRSLIHSVSVHCTGRFRMADSTSRLYFDGYSEGYLWTCNEDEELAKLIQRIVFRSYIYLGDLERYKVTHSDSSKDLRRWKCVNDLYEHAMKVDPSQGKPQSQLAIVSTNCKQNLETLFWYTLSISNTAPIQIAKGNLEVFHQKVSSRLKDLSAEPDLKGATLETVANCILHFHRTFLFHPNDSKLASWSEESYDLAKKSHDSLSSLFAIFIGTEEKDEGVEDVYSDRASGVVSKAVVEIIMKFFVIFIGAYHELTNLFLQKDKPPQIRQKIRDLQCITLSLLFRVADLCCLRLSNHMNETIPRVDSIPDMASGLFGPMGILSGWLVGSLIESEAADKADSGSTQATCRPTSGANADIFATFFKYTRCPGVSPNMREYYTSFPRFCRSFASLCTELLAFADIDGDTRTLPEDVGLLGFAPLTQFYTNTLDLKGVVVAMENYSLSYSNAEAIGLDGDSGSTEEVARASRLLVLARKMSERKEIEVFGFESKKSEGAGSAFVVYDEESKRLARLKTAKNLAAQLLKTQISDLETSISEADPISYPTLIPDISIYLSRLHIIKQLLNPTRRQPSFKSVSQRYRILVPMDIVHQLDVLKKGDGAVNARAREATRYLEQRFRYGSERLVAQQSGETVKDLRYEVDPRMSDLAEEKATLKEDDWRFRDPSVPPKPLRSFLGCAAFYRRRGIEDEEARLKRMEALNVAVSNEEESREAIATGRVWVLSEDDDMIDECRRCGLAVKTINSIVGTYNASWRR